jgi:predicted PurR-regulated permease PerM
MIQNQPIAVTVMVVLAVAYTLHVARAVLVPLVVAVLLHILLDPLVRRCRKAGVPRSLSSAAILLLLLLGLSLAGNYLVEPAREWLKDAPTSLRQLAQEFEGVKRPFEEVRELGEEVGEMTKLESGGTRAQKVEIKNPDGLDRFVQGIPAFLTALAITFLTAFFLLSAGDRLAQKVIGFGTSWRAKSQIIRMCREMQYQVSRHLRTITLINLSLGLLAGLALWALGVPNPELWGAMVALFNFAPYAGAIVSTVVLTVVGVTTSESMTEALMVPGVFLVLTSVEGGVITPLVLGRRLNLSPLVVFLSVVFWGWLWGVAGALIAVPIVSSIQVVLANLRSGQPFAKLMAG